MGLDDWLERLAAEGRQTGSKGLTNHLGQEAGEKEGVGIDRATSGVGLGMKDKRDL